MRIRVLLCAVIGIAVVVGAWGGLGRPVQAGMYTVSTHALKDKNGAIATALVDSKGMSLYYNAADTPTQSSCTGDCAKIWPPLVNDAPTKDPKILTGGLTVVHGANGAQVAFNGHLLYTYTGDAAPGEATGNGKAGKWYVATPALGKWY